MALSIAEHSYSLYLNISTDYPKQRKKEIQGKPEDPQDFLFRSPVGLGHSVSMQLSKAHGPSTLISVLAPGTLSENVYNFIKWIYKYPTELGTPSKQIMSCDVSGEKKTLNKYFLLFKETKNIDKRCKQNIVTSWHDVHTLIPALKRQRQ